MKNSFIFLLIIVPMMGFGQKYSEMTPDRIYARQYYVGDYPSIKDSTIFYYNSLKGSLRFGFVKTNPGELYSDGFKDNYIGNYTFGFGRSTIASAKYSMAGGFKTIASGVAAVSIGENNESRGDYSASFGQNAKALGTGAIAFSMGLAEGMNTVAFSGGHAKASGSMAFQGGRTKNQGGIAVGEGAEATAWHSSAFGRHITSNSKYCLTVGQFSDSTINATNQDDGNSPRFVVGTGFSGVNRQNGFVVLQSGNAYHKGSLGIKTVSPRASLDIVATDAIIVPVGTTTQRPSGGVLGMIRYNTTSNKYEGYTSTGWLDLH